MIFGASPCEKYKKKNIDIKNNIDLKTLEYKDPLRPKAILHWLELVAW